MEWWIYRYSQWRVDFHMLGPQNYGTTSKNMWPWILGPLAFVHMAIDFARQGRKFRTPWEPSGRGNLNPLESLVIGLYISHEKMAIHIHCESELNSIQAAIHSSFFSLPPFILPCGSPWFLHASSGWNGRKFAASKNWCSTWLWPHILQLFLEGARSLKTANLGTLSRPTCDPLRNLQTSALEGLRQVNLSHFHIAIFASYLFSWKTSSSSEMKKKGLREKPPFRGKRSGRRGSHCFGFCDLLLLHSNPMF